MEEIKIVELTTQPALVIKATAKTLAMGKVMAPAYEKIVKSINAAGVPCDEDTIPFCVYRNIDWDKVSKKVLLATINIMFFHKWELEIGIPIAETIAPIEGIESGEMPGGKFLKALHIGPYKTVGPTYERMKNYAEENQMELKNFSIERYLNDPRKRPAEPPRTELLVPIK